MLFFSIDQISSRGIVTAGPRIALTVKYEDETARAANGPPEREKGK